MVRKQILRAKVTPRDTFLGKVNNHKNNNKIMFNIISHPVFRNVRKILEEMHVILAPHNKHEKVFPDVPLNGFKNKSLRDNLVRSKLLDIEKISISKPCGGKKPRCHLCKSMKDTCTFKSKHFDEVYKINSTYNRNSIVNRCLFDRISGLW